MIFQALSLGFSTGLFCMASCMPTLTPLLLLSPEKGLRAGLGMVGIFLGGRLLTYCLLGLLSGLAGSLGSGLPYSVNIIALSQITLGGMMAVQAFYRHTHRHCRCMNLLFGSKRAVFVAGILTSVGLCPPILLAMSQTMENGSPWRGVVFFIFFFLATSVYVLPLSIVATRFSNRWVLWFSRILCLGTGVYFVFRGLASTFGERFIVY